MWEKDRTKPKKGRVPTVFSERIHLFQLVILIYTPYRRHVFYLTWSIFRRCSKEFFAPNGCGIKDRARYLAQRIAIAGDPIESVDRIRPKLSIGPVVDRVSRKNCTHCPPAFIASTDGFGR